MPAPKDPEKRALWLQRTREGLARTRSNPELEKKRIAASHTPTAKKKRIAAWREGNLEEHMAKMRAHRKPDAAQRAFATRVAHGFPRGGYMPSKKALKRMSLLAKRRISRDPTIMKNLLAAANTPEAKKKRRLTRIKNGSEAKAVTAMLKSRGVVTPPTLKQV